MHGCVCIFTELWPSQFAIFQFFYIFLFMKEKLTLKKKNKPKQLLIFSSGLIDFFTPHKLQSPGSQWALINAQLPQE